MELQYPDQIVKSKNKNRQDEYYYKLVRAKREDGKATTVSFDFVDYLRMQQKFRLSPEMLNKLIKIAAEAVLLESRTGKKPLAGVKFSPAVNRKTVALLKLESVVKPLREKSFGIARINALLASAEG